MGVLIANHIVKPKLHIVRCEVKKGHSEILT